VSLFPATVETDRLKLRRLTPDLVDPLSAYDVYAPTRSETIGVETEYVLFDPHHTPKETADFLAGAAERWESGEAAEYAVLPDDDPDAYDGPAVEGRPFAGTTGLFFEWDRRLAEPGIFLRRPFWGRGYSGERAAALVDLALDVLGLELVVVECLVDNDRSRRAIEKYVDRLGGRRVGRLRNQRVHDDEPVDVIRFSIGRDEWTAAVGIDDADDGVRGGGVDGGTGDGDDTDDGAGDGEASRPRVRYEWE
jgi:RimJ/RimL family protein N-acetyltransferase